MLMNRNTFARHRCRLATKESADWRPSGAKHLPGKTHLKHELASPRVVRTEIQRQEATDVCLETLGGQLPVFVEVREGRDDVGQAGHDDDQGELD